MHRFMWCAVALAAAAVPAYGQDSELSKLREELRQLQQRLQTLEKRLQETESKSSKAEESATRAESTATQAAQQASSRPQAESAMNPGISAIMNGVYANLKRDPTPLSAAAPNGFRINGFVPTMGDVAPGPRGLSLGESELGFSANIDPVFRGTLIAAISPDNSTINVEEGFIQTLGLSNGLTLKAGRFFSGVGYQNQVHAHAWDFTDTPLAMKAFLGGQLAEDGVQLRWVAPTDLYVELGLELGRGRAFPATIRNKNGFGSSNLFAHVGGDLGDSVAWQTGLSYLSTSPQDRQYGDFDSTGAFVTNSFTGASKLWVADGVLKWAPGGNPTSRSFKLQGEYFRRREDGNLTFNSALTGAYASRQSGWYLQGVYQFMPQWRVGYRYDTLDAGTTTIGLVDSGALRPAEFPILGAYNPKRNTLMVDWSPSEFSRVRLQFARDYSRMGMPDNQVFLQYIVSLGAHGAHRF